MDAGAQLFAKTDNIGSQDVKASVLLGSRGVDLPTMTNALAALATSAQTGTGFEQVSKSPIIELYYVYNSIIMFSISFDLIQIQSENHLLFPT